MENNITPQEASCYLAMGIAGVDQNIDPKEEEVLARFFSKDIIDSVVQRSDITIEECISIIQSSPRKVGLHTLAVCVLVAEADEIVVEEERNVIMNLAGRINVDMNEALLEAENLR